MNIANQRNTTKPACVAPGALVVFATLEFTGCVPSPAVRFQEPAKARFVLSRYRYRPPRTPRAQ